MPVTLILYRLLISLFATATLIRAARSGGLQEVRARLGSGPAQPGPHVWLHGASNGELASVRPLLDRLIAARPDMNWLVTANTSTGVRLVESWQLPRTSARLAPLDLRRVSRRTMRRWQVTAHVTLESELWPHRILACPGPTVLLGARMSEGTARSWSRLPRLARRILSRVAFCSAQDNASADRLTTLGLPPRAKGPLCDLKALYQAPRVDPDAELDRAFPRARTWLAASTHEGDETVALAAHARLLETDPQTRLILAPRHARRAEAIAAEAAALGLTTARRSLREPPDQVQVYIADTMGEMPLWYARAGRVFIGGTLSDRGGHTPYEPAAFGAALLHGPDTRNFTAAFDRLRRAGAAREIQDADSLAKALEDLSSPAGQRTAATAAAEALRQEGNLDRLATPILDLLPGP